MCLQKLGEKHRGCILPALPEKSTVQKFQMQADFLEQRRRALQVRAWPILCDHRAEGYGCKLLAAALLAIGLIRPASRPAPPRSC